MPSSPPPEKLLAWANAVLAEPGGELEVVAGDASHRRYFRLRLGDASYILVDAPPRTEKNAEFLAVRALLEKAGITVPALLGSDLEQGFLLLGDLGDRLLLPELDAGNVGERYRGAFDILLKLARLAPASPDWPAYDEALLSEELSRFPEWFVGRLLGQGLGSGGEQAWNALCGLLIESALAQPRVLVHRDFHSRNLMLQPGGELAVIDFQDAVVGPITYDLVSLLRDCYIRWPAADVESWALEYRDRLVEAGIVEPLDDGSFIRWFDLMGLQRHLKVLGTFARLYLRDDKTAYLDDLPLVLAYVGEILEKYRESIPVFAEFADVITAQLGPVIARQAWSANA